jgi:hypothetical protein
MSKLLKTTTACATFVLTLSALAGAGLATPGEGRTPSVVPQDELRLAHNGSEAVAPQAEHPERFVRIAGFVWSKAVPEDFMQANLTIKSALPFALKQVEVACAQFARTGVEVESSRRTIAELVPAHGSLQVAALNLGPVNPDAGSSGCWIVSVTPA